MTQMPNYNQMIQRIETPLTKAPKMPAAPMVQESQVNVGQLNINTEGTMMLYESLNNIVGSGIRLYETMMDLNFKEKKFEYEKQLEEWKRTNDVELAQAMKNYGYPLVNGGWTGGKSWSQSRGVTAYGGSQ